SGDHYGVARRNARAARFTAAALPIAVAALHRRSASAEFDRERDAGGSDDRRGARRLSRAHAFSEAQTLRRPSRILRYADAERRRADTRSARAHASDGRRNLCAARSEGTRATAQSVNEIVADAGADCECARGAAASRRYRGVARNAT